MMKTHLGLLAMERLTTYVRIPVSWFHKTRIKPMTQR
jgi:hypothetical protein